MNLKFYLSRALGAVIGLIALLTLPSIASAHEGHARDAQLAASVSVNHHVDKESATVSARSADSLSLELRTSDSNDTPSCAGTCCSGAPCGGCVALSFVESFKIGPDLRGSSVGLHASAPMSGFVPEGLRKPPRSFT